MASISTTKCHYSSESGYCWKFTHNSIRFNRWHPLDHFCTTQLHKFQCLFYFLLLSQHIHLSDLFFVFCCHSDQNTKTPLKIQHWRPSCRISTVKYVQKEWLLVWMVILEDNFFEESKYFSLLKKVIGDIWKWFFCEGEILFFTVIFPEQFHIFI